ncbi:Transcriptional activator MetR [hydrothermal vent metagenome]|uniref:HTH-type transcriptional regulator MetR n=1 Tax=hydrothermal vent metagenome TaxID=652676 RepID=A0A3B0XUC1_9ZZZZ
MFLELRHLRSIRAIDESNNLAQAAERLHLTQSALSHQIKAVEGYFDIELYRRKHKPLRLSHAGQRLLSLAQRVLVEVEVAEVEMKHLSGADSGRLHITIECHSCFEWLVPTLDCYRKHWPDVEVDLRLGNTFEPIRALTQEDVDLVITTDRVAQTGIIFEPLFDYQAMVIMANDHPLTERGFVEAADFAEQTLITYPVEQQRLDIFRYFLAPQHVAPKAIRQSELTVMILQLVASGRGIAVLPDWVINEYIEKKYVAARPLGEQGMGGTLYAGIREREAKRVYLTDFIELARDGLFRNRGV